MKRWLLVILASSAGCASSYNRMAVHAERILEAGDRGWDVHTDNAIADCRKRQLPTRDERLECVAEVQAADDKVGEIVVRAIAALRLYWEAVAAGASPDELRKRLADLRQSVNGLPPEFFGGLKGTLR